MTKMLKNILVAAGVVFGIVFAFTFGELVTALINRYSVYPSGTDTSMLANYFLFALLFIFLSFLSAFWLLRKKKLGIILLSFVMLVIWWSEVVSIFVPDSWCKYELKIYSCNNYTWQGK